MDFSLTHFLVFYPEHAVIVLDSLSKAIEGLKNMIQPTNLQKVFMPNKKDRLIHPIYKPYHTIMNK